MKNYRSSIPKAAQERIVATYVMGPQKYKAEYILNGEVVGFRFFEENGNLMSETPLKNGRQHGTQYFFDQGRVDFCETYLNGLAHGIAKQWSPDDELIGTYTMKHGTGLDLWCCKNNWGNGSIFLSEEPLAKLRQQKHFEVGTADFRIGLSGPTPEEGVPTLCSLSFPAF